MNGYFDIHCHILPGVDDGSRDMGTSLAMLKKEYEDGIRNLILTPHFRYRMFETDLEILKSRFLELKEKAAAVLPELSLYLGSEIHVSLDMAEKLREGRRLSMAGSSYVLLEFSGSDEKNLIRESVRNLMQSGYLPVIAHVERIHAIRENMDFPMELKSMGAFLQVNADTISGLEGFGEKMYAKKMMKYDLIDFVGSDAHGMDKRRPEMGKCIKRMEKVMGEAYVRHILVDNPEKIVQKIRREE